MIQILNLPEQINREYISEFKRRNLPFKKIKIPPGYKCKVNVDNLAKMMKKRLKKGKPVVINGNGDYHHLTYGICSVITEPFGYIHLDNHSDLGLNRDRLSASMGGFVNNLVLDTEATHGLLIGCESIKKYPTISYYDLDNLERRLSKYLPFFPDQVYVSVDLDVLNPKWFKSGYSHGRMRPFQLFETLNIISREKEIIGGDICGYNGNCSKSLEIAIKTILKIDAAVNK